MTSPMAKVSSVRTVPQTPDRVRGSSPLSLLVGERSGGSRRAASHHCPKTTASSLSARIFSAAASASERVSNGPTRTRVRLPLGLSSSCVKAARPASINLAWALRALPSSANSPTLM